MAVGSGDSEMRAGGRRWPQVQDSVPTHDGSAHAAPENESHRRGSFFGRGAAYVLVWSLQVVVTAIVSPVMAHLVSANSFGQLASALALHQFLLVVAVLGMDHAILLASSERGRPAARNVAFAASILPIGVTLLALTTISVWAPVAGFPKHAPILVPTILWTAPAGMCQAYLAVLRSADDLRRFSIVSIVAAIGGQVVGIGLAILVHRSVSLYAWGGVVAQSVAVLLGMCWTRPTLRGMVGRRVVAAFKIGIPLAVGALAFFILNMGDRIIIQRELGSASVGRYQVAYILGSVLMLMLGFLNQSWEPLILAIPGRVKRYEVDARVRATMIDIVTPLPIALILMAPPVLAVLTPRSYRQAGLLAVVAWISLAALPAIFVNAGQRLLIAERRALTVGTCVTIAAGANIVLNFLLIPRFGITGSAAATTLALLLQALVLDISLGRRAGLMRFRRSSGFRLLAAAVLSLGAVVLPTSGSSALAVRMMLAMLAASLAFVYYLNARHRERSLHAK